MIDDWMEAFNTWRLDFVTRLDNMLAQAGSYACVKDLVCRWRPRDAAEILTEKHSEAGNVVPPLPVKVE